MKPRPNPLLLISATVALASAHAAPLLHEPFSNRTTGNLPGQVIGSAGFASGGAWDGLNSSFGSVVADASTVQASGLGWGILASDAQHALVKGDDSNTRAMMDVSPTGVFATSGLRDAGSNTIGGGAVQGSLYLSFVLRAVAADRNNEYGGLQLARTNSGATGVFIGNGWQPWAYSMHLPQTGSYIDLRDHGGSGNYLQMDNQTHFFVARIDYAANAPDNLTVWMDPDLGAPETAQNLSGVYMGTATGDFSFDRFFLRGGTATHQFGFDEIRMGTTWGDVTPLASAPLSNEHLRVTLREDGTISRLMAFREGAWEEIAFRNDNLRGPQWQVTTGGSTECIALTREAGTSSFSGTRNGQNYRFTYQLNGPSLDMVARVENPGGSPWAPERATICLGINSYMEGYPEWNLRYFPTLLRCEKTHFWGYSMSPLGRILGYASKDPVASWRHDYEYGAHRILTSYLDLLQSDPVPARHPQDATQIPAGQSREWRVSLFDIPSLEEAPAAFATATAAPAIQASRYHGKSGETTTLTILGPLVSLTEDGVPVAFTSSGETHTADWTFPATLGEHRILATNATGQISECVLVTRHPWSWYLKQARTEAVNKPQKASTHTESWYGLFSGFLARRHFPNAQEDNAIQAKLDELFPLMYDTATSLPTVAPDRVQNHSSMAGVLVDRYQATGDITSLERASILCDFLITKQGADGAYYSGGTHYTSVIYIAKSIMEVMAEEKKLADAGSAVWQERYDRHYLSAKRAMDDLVARGANIQTEGQQTFEDGMISCSYTQLAEFALLQTDPAQRAIYTNAAVALAESHRSLSQKLVPDGRLNGGSLRFWESQYDILANSSNMMGSPHGWSAWRLYGLRSLYELTGDPKYLRDAMNGLGSCVQTIHPATGELRWGFIVDPSVRAGIFTEFPANPGKGRCVPAVIGEQYLSMISGWYRAPANTLVSGYGGGNSNGAGLAPGESWPANWSPSGVWGGDGGCCDNDVHEIFKCLEEIALTSAYLIPGPGNTAEVWNGTAQWEGDTLVFTPAEAVVSRVHINRPPGVTTNIVVNFGGELVNAPATGSVWVEKLAANGAADLSWDDGTATGNWNTTDANWTGAVWNNTGPDSAIFGSTGVGTVTLTEGITVQNITFAAPGYTITGNTLTTGTAGDTQITTDENATIGSLITGAAGTLRKRGAATLTLTGANTYSGGVAIENGTLEVSSSGKLYSGGYTASPVVTVNAGAALRLNGWSWDAAGSIANLDYGRDRLVVNGGTLEYTGASNLNPGDPGSSSRNFTIGTGGATLKASSSPGETWTITSGNGNLINNESLTLDGAGAGVMDKVIEGTGGLTKTGSGTWTLAGANTYSGTTTVTAGVLSVGNGTNSSNLSDSAAVTVGQVPASGAKIDLNFTGLDIIGSLSLDGTDAGTGFFDATSHPTYFSGGGQLFVSSGPIADNDGTWASSTDGYWEIPGNWASNTIASGIDRTATFNGALGTTVSLLTSITIGNLDFSVEDYTIAGAALTLDASGIPGIGVASGRTATISADLAGIAGMEKTGDGVLLLTGVKTYTGGTTVSGGTLELNNASTYDLSTVSGSVTVASGATLKLSGLDYTGLGRLGERVTNLEVNGGTVENTIQSWVAGATVNLDGGTMDGAGTYHIITSNFYSFESATTSTISNSLLIRKDYGSADLNVDVADGTAATDLLISGNINQLGGAAGLNKFGLGKLEFSGANTYTGNTIVSEGTLALTSTSEMQFVVTDAPASNMITGTGAVTCDGVFKIDTSAVAGTSGYIWLLVDRASLTGESFDSNFSVAGFVDPEDDGVWTMTDAKGDWSFSETTGELTLDIGDDFDTWRTDNGVTGGENDDDDNDGMTNREEYAFGLIPTSGSSLNPITVPLDTTNGTFSYTRRLPSLTELTYSVWYSTDLAGWTEDTGAAEGTPVVNGEVETVPVTLTNSLLANPSLFIQVRAE